MRARIGGGSPSRSRISSSSHRIPGSSGRCRHSGAPKDRALQTRDCRVLAAHRWGNGVTYMTLGSMAPRVCRCRGAGELASVCLCLCRRCSPLFYIRVLGHQRTRGLSSWVVGCFGSIGLAGCAHGPPRRDPHHEGMYITKDSIRVTEVLGTDGGSCFHCGMVSCIDAIKLPTRTAPNPVAPGRGINKAGLVASAHYT